MNAPVKDKISRWVLFLSTCAFFAIAAHELQDTLDRKSFRAYGPDAQSPFVVFMSDLEDHVEPGVNGVFGWGGVAEIRKAASQLAKHIYACKQYKTPEDIVFRYDVKVNFNKFKIVGILAGSEQNPQMASCIRDKINSAVLAPLAELKGSSEEKYTLKLEVRSNVGQEMIR